MKKRILIAIAVMTTTCALLTACGGSKSTASTPDVPVKDLASELATQVKYSEELKQLEADDIAHYVTIEDGVESDMYMSSGTSGEEVVVFKAQDEQTATTMKANAQEFLDDQYSSFKDYIPEAADRVKNALVVQKGNYVVVCVTDDQSAASDIIEDKLGK